MRAYASGVFIAALFLVASAEAEHQPLYRFRDNHRQHFYTTSCEEAKRAKNALHMSFEGVMGYLSDDQIPGSFALLRFSTKPDGRLHFYTVDEREITADENALLRWNLDGIQGYVVHGPGKDLIPLYRAYSPSSGDHFYTTDQAELLTAETNFHYQREPKTQPNQPLAPYIYVFNGGHKPCSPFD